MECASCQAINPDDAQHCQMCGLPLYRSKSDVHKASTDELFMDSNVTPVEPFIRKLLASSDETPKQIHPGDVLSHRYDIMAEIAEGGMGKLYKAWDRTIEEVVALKVIRPDLKQRKDLLARFKNEIKLARQITHPNVARIHDIFESDGIDFITMSFIEGQDLGVILEKQKKFGIEDGISIAKQICQVLIAANEAGIIHRDLKPANVMLDQNRKVFVLDFGLARSIHNKDMGITTDGIVVGTPAYMSPEQVEGEVFDSRSDIYSLGVILYEIFTGQLPFQGASPLSTALKHVQSLPTSPRKFNADIPKRLDRIILRCLEKKREDRYQNAQELLDDLNHLILNKTWRFHLPEKRWRKFAFGVFVLGFLCGTSFLAWVYLTDAQLRPGWFVPLKMKSRSVVAVIDFENLTHDLRHEWLCQGIAESVANRLTDLSTVRVVTREKILGIAKNVPGQADSTVLDRIVMAVRMRRLDIDWVIAGTFQVVGNTIRINTQLIDTKNGQLIGGTQVDGDILDILNLQDQVFKDLAQDIQSVLAKSLSSSFMKDTKD